ncbi:ferredoxin [Halobacteriales archaeon SW_10_68_16]|jgi:ferredoxin|nr:MAG: ferredoxin [Halobacteriales archaeon SW_10_68_16]
MYRVTIDTDACEGIFACLVRDDRFVESEDGLADFDTTSAETYRTGEHCVVAEFDDDRLERARQAAAACPPGAISIEVVDDGAGGAETPDERSEEAVCR